MDLLPKSSDEFSSQQYWDTFFSKRKEDPFEWYGEYPELSGLLHKYITPKDALLIVGCGNSSLSADLHSAGIKNQKSLDISSVVVGQMKARYPHIEFVEGDVTKMTFPDGSFSCIMDKGTVDALSPFSKESKRRNKTEEVEDTAVEVQKVDLMLAEIARTLKPGGRFLCVSLLQPHVASKLLSYFHALKWMVRVVRCLDAEAKTALKSEKGEKSFVFPVFMCIFTKLSLPSGLPPIIEASSPSNALQMRRLKDLEDLLSFVKDQQNFSLVHSRIQHLGTCAEQGIQLQLSNPQTGEDRFILNVVDVPKLFNNPMKQKFGVFIVPQGRESEWLFGTHEGRITLATQANFARLVVVHLVRDQTYQDMNSVQQEIRDSMSFLSPSCVQEKGIKAPIMTVGEDVGERSIVCRGSSEFSGDFVVEDVKCNSQIFRRLIFLNAPNLIQSEVELSVVRKRGKKFRNPDIGKLSCQHHTLMLTSFGMLQVFYPEMLTKTDPVSTNAVLIGLGGGLLASFLVNFMPNLHLTVVEIDSEMVKIAKELFGLPETDRLHVMVEDGLKFVQSTESQYNVIFIDVDNKSTKEGLSCPPPAFLEPSMIENYHRRLKPEGSVLVVNLVCRNSTLKRNYVTVLESIFPFVLQYDIPNEVNSLIFCFVKTPYTSTKQVANTLVEAIKVLQTGFKQPASSKKQTIGSKNQRHQGSASAVDHFDGALEDPEDLSKNFKILKLDS